MKFSAARSELDPMVVEIELTLVSIIRGVALTVLIENAHAVIAERQLFSGAQRARLADRSRAAWVRRIFGLRRSLLCQSRSAHRSSPTRMARHLAIAINLEAILV